MKIWYYERAFGREFTADEFIFEGAWRQTVLNVKVFYIGWKLWIWQDALRLFTDEVPIWTMWQFFQMALKQSHTLTEVHIKKN